MVCRVYFLLPIFIIAGCDGGALIPNNSSALEQPADSKAIETFRLKAEIAADNAKEEALRAVEAAELSPTPVAAPAKKIDAADLCYKDYCPCEPPQGGPDMLFCDRLEEGLNVDTEQMILGRSMREARRQIATGDY